MIFLFFFHPFTMLELVEKHQASLTGFHLSDVNVKTTQTCKKEINEIIMQKFNHISIVNEKRQKDSLTSPEKYQLSPSLCAKVRTRPCARLCPSELQPYKSELSWGQMYCEKGKMFNIVLKNERAEHCLRSRGTEFQR